MYTKEQTYSITLALKHIAVSLTIKYPKDNECQLLKKGLIDLLINMETDK